MRLGGVDDTGGGIRARTCSVGFELVMTGLGVDMLAGLLDLRLSVATFLAAQLAVVGKADPSPLSLRLIASSRTA